ncbi:hypothetical protein H1V43_24070 [Streptomyces sp. PSKA54]|uniref:Prenyltransferase n=1 Tax=Streptomyces himalayensis subsp. aureolus TaxID=2758039 RepID=A0A7W2HI20_9ACTN|nr:hypothetical protein [Streptomyces himalayensis]MBA4864374.1 hypothetical protein [Streptomyces himalayensis subsp. aureolus]
MTDAAFFSAREFIRREGRLLERRLFACLFEGADPSGVVDALRGYQNPDGGFAHGLEPDKLCPASLPIDVEMALQALADAGITDEQMVQRACDWLQSVAARDGAVALASPVIEQYPRAEHWSEWTYAPGLNPTAGLAGRLHRLGVEHPWLTTATAWCWSALEAGLPEDAHALAEALVFLEHVPDRARAESLASGVGECLPKLSLYRAAPDDPGYGITPLHLAPTPDSRWRRLFADDLIEGHLERLRRDQQPDGGWAITWQPPSSASTLAFRGIETLRALQVLTAYGS